MENFSSHKVRESALCSFNRKFKGLLFETNFGVLEEIKKAVEFGRGELRNRASERRKGKKDTTTFVPSFFLPLGVRGRRKEGRGAGGPTAHGEKVSSFVHNTFYVRKYVYFFLQGARKKEKGRRREKKEATCFEKWVIKEKKKKDGGKECNGMRRTYACIHSRPLELARR